MSTESLRGGGVSACACLHSGDRQDRLMRSYPVHSAKVFTAGGGSRARWARAFVRWPKKKVAGRRGLENLCNHKVFEPVRDG